MSLTGAFPNFVHCDWEILRGASLVELITADDASNMGGTICDPEEFISMERATQFAPKSNTVDSENIHCYLLFNVQPTHHISNIRLTSEASKIEVFTGDDAEYLTVQFGQLLDQVDDMGVYLFDFQIPNGVEKVSLKFFPKKPLFWIIGLQLQLKQHHIPKNTTKHTINLHHVQTILDSSKIQLTDSAERCKQFLSMHMGNGSSATHSQGPPKFADMMAFVNQQSGALQESQQTPTLSADCNAPNNDGAIPKKENTTQNPSAGQDVASLHMVKAYFDLRLQEMETRILHQLRAAEERQSMKLDSILKALTERRSDPIDAIDKLTLD